MNAHFCVSISPAASRDTASGRRSQDRLGYSIALQVWQRQPVDLSITLNPYKLTLKELEALVESPDASDPLLPGQFVRFEGTALAYGKITGVRNVSPTGRNEARSGCMVRVMLVHGTPAMNAQSVTVLTDSDMAHEVQRMQEPFENPLPFGEGFTAECHRLGALTVIEGDDFNLKYNALMMLVSAIRPYQRLLLIDPLGVFTASDSLKILRAGENVRLSLQQVGSKRFLSAFGETLPDNLCESALSSLAEHWPKEQPGLTGFQKLLEVVSEADMPVKNLILQNLQAAAETRVFAEVPDHGLDFSTMTSAAIVSVDLSGLSEPWKTLFYEEVCREIYRNAGSDVVPVLIYPENYLTGLASWIQKADEAELNLILLASPYLPDNLKDLANNLISVDAAEYGKTAGRVHLSGDLTLGLPVSFPLLDTVFAAGQSTTGQNTNGSSHPSQANVNTAVFQKRTGPAPVAVDISQPAHIQTNQAPWEVPAVVPSAETSFSQSTATLPPVAMPFEAAQEPQEHRPMSPEELAMLMGHEPPSQPVMSADEPLFGFPEDEAGFSDFEFPETVPETDQRPQANAYVEMQPDYPDADEGALSEPPLDAWASPVTSGMHGTAAGTKSRDFAHHGEGALDLSVSGTGLTLNDDDDFSFDVNLDQYFSNGVADVEVLETPQEMPAEPPIVWTETSVESESFAAEPVVLKDESFAPVTMDAQSLPVPEAADDFSFADDLNFQDPDTPHGDSGEDPLSILFPNSVAAGQMAGAPASLQQGVPLLSHEATPGMAISPELDEIPIVQKPVEDDVVNLAGFKAGDRVRHESYGLGIVNKVVPMEQDIILNITFDTVGKRLLDPSRCTLTKES